jgi:hypothetical protein
MLKKFDKQRALAVEEERRHHFTGFLRWGRIHVSPVTIQQKSILFLMVSLQVSQ